MFRCTFQIATRIVFQKCVWIPVARKRGWVIAEISQISRFIDTGLFSFYTNKKQWFFQKTNKHRNSFQIHLLAWVARTGVLSNIEIDWSHIYKFFPASNFWITVLKNIQKFAFDHKGKYPLFTNFTNSSLWTNEQIGFQWENRSNVLMNFILKK